MRVQIPAYRDSWMRGDRYGEVLRVTRSPDSREVACVRLDISGKTIRVILTDCTPLD